MLTACSLQVMPTNPLQALQTQPLKESSTDSSVPGLIAAMHAMHDLLLQFRQVQQCKSRPVVRPVLFCISMHLMLMQCMHVFPSAMANVSVLIQKKVLAHTCLSSSSFLCLCQLHVMQDRASSLCN